jgi:hypothetical protein
MWKAPTDFGLAEQLDDGIVMLDPIGSAISRADYWQVDPQNGHATLLAEDLGLPQRLGDGSFASVRVGERAWYGTLEIADDDTRRYVDTRVYRELSSPYLLSPAPAGWPYDSDVVLWRVHDGERSGLWGARAR